MKLEIVKNDPYVKIGFAKTYGELPDEYGGADMYSNASGSFWDIFSTERSRAKKDAQIEASKAKTQFDLAIAKALGEPTPQGMSTGAIIGLSLGALVIVGATIYFIRKRK